MSLPLLMKDRVDHFAASYSQDASGGPVAVYPSLPTTSQIPCNFQPAESEVKPPESGQRRRREVRKASVFLINSTAFNAIGIADKIVGPDGSEYHVSSKQNLIGFNRVFEITLTQQQGA